MWGRRLMIAVLMAIVIAGLIGFFGVRSRSATASANGYDLEVRYASIARPGITVPFEVEVTKEGGFDGPVTVEVSTAYLQALDVDSITPDPSNSTSDGDVATFEFEQPDGDTLEISWAAKIDPSADMGRREAVVSIVENGEAATNVSITTWVLP
jgi:hypothetical protein